MSFAAHLHAAKGDLTARQLAACVSSLLSHRTVEKWLAGDNEPPTWAQAWILGCVQSPKKQRPRKGQNDQADPQNGRRETQPK